MIEIPLNDDQICTWTPQNWVKMNYGRFSQMHPMGKKGPTATLERALAEAKQRRTQTQDKVRNQYAAPAFVKVGSPFKAMMPSLSIATYQHNPFALIRHRSISRPLPKRAVPELDACASICRDRDLSQHVQPLGNE